MSAAHTPGPWIIKVIPADQGASPHFIVESADINAGDYVAEVYTMLIRLTPKETRS